MLYNHVYSVQYPLNNIMSMNGVGGISPLLQGRNGYLPSIGRKDRFLVDAKKNKQNRNIEHKSKKNETLLHTRLWVKDL